jgi:uncharacterized protein YndB with AHSA1/START domain
MTTSTINPAVRPALLFMPDISGFTEFVTGNEILHAQHIIQEILNLLVETNEMNMLVEEIEGDAVFFYRYGAPPALADLLRQVQNMFTRFHQHLRQYEQQRLCTCGACNHAVNLQLKIFAHFGEVTGYEVGEYRKLFGRDVIVLHRLLKNSLHLREYVLLTDHLLEATPPSAIIPSWFQPYSSHEDYDVGAVSFQVNDLTALLQQLPPVELRVVPSPASTTTVLTEEVVIPAPTRDVYKAVFNVEERCGWMDGVEQTVMVDEDRINRLGTRYRYKSREGNGPVMVTSSAQVEVQAADLVEMEETGTEGRRYAVHSLGENETKLTISVLLKKSWWRIALFRLLHQNPLKKKLRASLHHLNRRLGKGCE